MVRFAIFMLPFSLIVLSSVSLGGGFVRAQWIIYLILVPGSLLVILIVSRGGGWYPADEEDDPLKGRIWEEPVEGEAPVGEETPQPFSPEALRGPWKGTARLWPLDRRSTLSLFDVRLAFDPPSGTVHTLPVSLTPRSGRLTQAELRAIDWARGRVDLELLVERGGNLHRYPTLLVWRPAARGRPSPRLVAEVAGGHAGHLEDLTLELLPDRSANTVR